MAKKKRRSFPGDELAAEKKSPRRSRPQSENELIDADNFSPGLFGAIRNPARRELFESLVIAILLAFMFKTFEAEAFIIPTGSMAPSLQGAHMDLECSQCGHRYLTGASVESRIVATNCPICNFRTEMNPAINADHQPNSGDRILVNKFIYDFAEPERFDVIVFKNPQNGKQNFIKRLIGLPGENILIENGDVYTMTPNESGGWDRQICRKSPAKLRQVLIDVDDSKYFGADLDNVDWPSRWNQWTENPSWNTNSSGSESQWRVDAESETQWLRYRHLAPMPSQWPTIKNGTLPSEMNVATPLDLPLGRLITDTHAYNNLETSRGRPRTVGLGFHWVGDLGVESWFDVDSDSGVLEFDVVEGGVHFTCKIDVATGQATLHSSDPKITFESESESVATPTAQTDIKGPGSYRILFLNADDQLLLWVDDRIVEFDASTYRRAKVPTPKYSTVDPGDAEPVGIGANGLAVSVKRLKVVRDIYYSSINSDVDDALQIERNNLIANETGLNKDMVARVLSDPTSWDGEDAALLFRTKRNAKKPMFKLEKGSDYDKHQFLPMGDNSTRSLDARLWTGEHYVERDLLIGRAIFVYWPHTLNKPVKHFPNFGKMKFIR